VTHPPPGGEALLDVEQLAGEQVADRRAGAVEDLGDVGEPQAQATQGLGMCCRRATSGLLYRRGPAPARAAGRSRAISS